MRHSLRTWGFAKYRRAISAMATSGLVLASLFVTPTVSAAPTPRGNYLGETDTCADVLFVAIRGSGQSAGYGAEEAIVMGGLIDSLSDTDLTIRSHSIDYTAAPTSDLVGDLGRQVNPFSDHHSDYFDSIDDGIEKLIAYLGGEQTRCRLEKWVLSGYSQGALVLHLVLNSGFQDADKIAGVLMVADPLRDPDVPNIGSAASGQGIYSSLRVSDAAMPPALFSRTYGLCDYHDVVCDTQNLFGGEIYPPFPLPGNLGSQINAGVATHTSYSAPDLRSLSETPKSTLIDMFQIASAGSNSFRAPIGVDFTEELNGTSLTGQTVQWRIDPDYQGVGSDDYEGPGVLLVALDGTIGGNLPAGRYVVDLQLRGSPTATWQSTQATVRAGAAGGATQDLDYCTQYNLPANDDGFSEKISLPFPVNFYGQDFDSLFVNNNGNVTFGESGLSQYTPDDLTTSSHIPMIAPYFGDVDTRNSGSRLVSYGISPDSKTFCANWLEVGYYNSAADKLNSFQLLLTARGSATGRSAGDFDATFNYDQIEWESGDASGGANGLGGTTASVGYTAGTGDDGTYFQFAGSLEPGSLIDGGAHALNASSLNSTTPGRYIFEIRNAEAQVRLGSLAGTVTSGADSAPASGAAVQVCAAEGQRCFYTTTSGSGGWNVPGLPVGDYVILVNPPAGSTGMRTGSGTATVLEGETTTVSVINLGQLQLPSARVTYGNQDPDIGQLPVDGVPSVYWDDPTVLTVTHATGEACTYDVTFTDGSLALHGDLDEAPIGSGTYTGVIPSFYPAHGEARISVSCDGLGPAEVFDIYIDPSGTVIDPSGSPIAGATVTLQRSDSEDGPFETVPDGSAIMSPSNRTNPWVTGASGRFAWDVTSGWYRLSASASGYNTVVTTAFAVPPPRLDLEIQLTPVGSPAVPSTAADSPADPLLSHRIAGANRYVTSALLAQEYGAANGVVLANGTTAKDGADALSANYLAGIADGPILLTRSNSVDDAVLAAVRAVLKDATNPVVYVMGGVDSVSDAVANQVKAAAAKVAAGTVTVTRIGGEDRYGTAALAARLVTVSNAVKFAPDRTAAKTAILASGTVNADALAAGALSSAWGIPVLLTRAGALSDSVRDAISAQGIMQLIVLGGEDRVSKQVLNTAAAAGITSVHRIAGGDRFETAAQLYGFAMNTITNESGEHYGDTGADVYLANGLTGFPDALAAGPLAGKTGSPLLMVRPNAVSPSVIDFLTNHREAFGSVTGLGSNATVSAGVLAAARTAIG